MGFEPDRHHTIQDIGGLGEVEDECHALMVGTVSLRLHRPGSSKFWHEWGLARPSAGLWRSNFITEHVGFRKFWLVMVTLLIDQPLGAMLQLNLSLPPDPKAGVFCGWWYESGCVLTVSQRDGVLWYYLIYIITVSIFLMYILYLSYEMSADFTNECLCCGLRQQCYRQYTIGLLRETFSVLMHVFGLLRQNLPRRPWTNLPRMSC